MSHSMDHAQVVSAVWPGGATKIWECHWKGGGRLGYYDVWVLGTC